MPCIPFLCTSKSFKSGMYFPLIVHLRLATLQVLSYNAGQCRSVTILGKPCIIEAN